jgi:transcriptional regulator with XRE-family HTH domain
MKRSPLPTTNCTACRGGLVPGPTAGEVLRREREERDVTRAALIEHFGFSESYTIDLERGARPFSWELVDSYRQAIEAAVTARLQEVV